MYWKNTDKKMKVLGNWLEPNEVLDLSKWEGTTTMLILARLAQSGIGTLLEELPQEEPSPASDSEPVVEVVAAPEPVAVAEEVKAEAPQKKTRKRRTRKKKKTEE